MKRFDVSFTDNTHRPADPVKVLVWAGITIAVIVAIAWGMG